MKRSNVWIAIALISAAACGGSGSTGTPPIGNTPPPAGGVSVTNNAFSPASKTVPVNTPVQWAWNTCTGDPYGGNQTCVSHSVTFDDGTTSSALQDQGTFSRSFAAAGTYNYHCSVHVLQGMTGTITVQ